MSAAMARHDSACKSTLITNDNRTVQKGDDAAVEWPPIGRHPPPCLSSAAQTTRCPPRCLRCPRDSQRKPDRIHHMPDEYVPSFIAALIVVADGLG